MHARLALAALVLTGCPGAMLIGMATTDRDRANLHAPNAADYASWQGVPKVELETHRQLALLPREMRKLSDGSELWILRNCPKKGHDECCLHEFVIRDASVAQYRTAGPCGVDCSGRPEPKIQACETASQVPDGYR